jgi:hypothetical protein
MVTLDEAVGLGAADNGLAFVATLRSDNGALPHPVSGEPVLGLVTYGKVKLANLAGAAADCGELPQRLAVGDREGRAELVGPDDTANLAHRAGQVASAAA